MTARARIKQQSHGGRANQGDSDRVRGRCGQGRGRRSKHWGEARQNQTGLSRARTRRNSRRSCALAQQLDVQSIQLQTASLAATAHKD